MHDVRHVLRLRLLDEAVGRDDHADALAELAAGLSPEVHVPTLWVLARSQRIRAMELRGRAAALVRQGASGGRPVGR